jgi:asparagine synthase (glutamine-hydrolysing)
MTVRESAAGFTVQRRAYAPAEAPPAVPLSIDEATEQLIELLRDTVRSHLVADVDVGLLLSGGLDSTLLAAIMRDLRGTSFRTFSVADDEANPDAVQAARVAEWLGCRHEVTVMSFDDYLAAIPGYVLAAERKPLLGSVPLYILCGRIGGGIKVCLNGEGADEVFGGYPEYRISGHGLLWLVDRVRAVRAAGLEPSARALEIVAARRPGSDRDDYLRRIFAVNLREQLARRHLEPLDGCSMAAGIEMRVPYLDRQVVGFAGSLPTGFRVHDDLGVQKHVLRRAALAAYGDAYPMIDAALRRKVGVPHLAGRYLSRFDELCDQTLPDDYLDRHELGPCLAGKRDLLLLELFEEIMITNRGAVPAGFSMPAFVEERGGVVRAAG